MPSPAAPTEPVYVRPDEAARRLSVCPATIFNLLASGRLKGYRLPGVRATLIRVEELDGLLTPKSPEDAKHADAAD